MLKFLLILFLISYIAIRVGGFVYRLLFSGYNHSRQGNFSSQSQRQTRKKAPGSNLNIDHVPDEKKNGKHFDDGEYVDFEELK